MSLNLGILDEINALMNEARRLTSELGTLPSTVRDTLVNIRERLLQVSQRIEEEIRAVSNRVENTVQQVQQRINAIIDNLLQRFEPILSALENASISLGGNIGAQIGDLITTVGNGLSSLRELIPIIQATPRIVKNIPSYIITGTIILLIVIALGILIYRFIMVGTRRLGIDPLIVLGCLIAGLIAVAIVLGLYLRMRTRVAIFQ